MTFSLISFLFPVIGYLLGSIPFGLILTRLAGHEDIRTIGSGNIGATNVLRTGNKGLALLTLWMDILKGAAAVWLSFTSANALIILITGVATVAGHMYPVWLKFKGGKGVATGLGVAVAFMPPLGLTMFCIWLGVAAWKRMSSLAGLSAFAAAPFMALLWIGDYRLAIAMTVIAALIFWRHRANIRRLLAGTEPKIGQNDAPAA